VISLGEVRGRRCRGLRAESRTAGTWPTGWKTVVRHNCWGGASGWKQRGCRRSEKRTRDPAAVGAQLAGGQIQERRQLLGHYGTATGGNVPPNLRHREQDEAGQLEQGGKEC
jgi:hypothetical protein